MAMEQKHRSTLKQQNKTHKTGRHKSKGQLQKEQKGRVSVKVLSKKAKSVLGKQERRNQISQLRKQKRDDVLTKKRSRGTAGSPPFLVAIISLCEGLDLKNALEMIEGCDEEAKVQTNDLGVTHISLPRFKQRFAFITPEYGNICAMLDAAKVADSLLFLVSPDVGIDSYGDYCLTCLFAQGLPAAVIAVQGLKNMPIKKQVEAKKMIQKLTEKRFPGEKLHTLDNSQDALLVVRTVGSHKMRPVYMRDHRPHLLAENVSFELADEKSQFGTLKVSGYVRNQALSVNSLVHIPGWGDFQMSQIDAPTDPYPINARTDKSKKKGNMDVEMDSCDMEENIKVLEKANPAKQESLQAENEPDPMDGEQTWPTEEELAQADAEAKARKVMKKVPKGTSEYQAAWIVDDTEDEDDEGSSDDEEDDMDMAEDGEEDEESDSGEEEEDEEDYEEMVLTDGDDAKYDATIDEDEEKQMLLKYKEARMNQMFPDEVDTPSDVPARVRFQKYRGLKSFRTSPWDSNENLPMDYAKIFQFKDFRRTKKRIISEERDEGALAGWYVTLHINNVPREFMETYTPASPIVVFGLLPHEQKMSVVNMVIKRHPCNNAPVKSKERMIFHVGYRRYAACPIYSQHTNGDKHKYERFLTAEGTSIATVFAPIIFPPASVLMFKETSGGHHELVATGSVISANPNRIVAKRIVLSGHPFKLNKKTAVVRYMFFHREDINWFKPVELRTKHGRRGHIKEPLGTHGHMKCLFDGHLKSMDTVLLNLYKRVFPKWTYEPRLSNPPIGTAVPIVQMDSEDMTSDFFE